MTIRYNPWTGKPDYVMAPGTGTAAIQFDTDSGSVTPTGAGLVTVDGGDGLTTSGSGSTLTISLDAPVSVARGGTGNTTLTAGGLLLGNGTSATTDTGVLSKGTILVGDGAGAPTNLAVGADALVLTADSSEASGVKWAAGGGGSSPLTTKGDIYGYDTANARLPIGADTYVLTADSSEALGVKWEAPSALNNGWNGSILESADNDVSSDGATITFSTEKSGGGNLTVVFSDGLYTWDTTPAATVSLTAGTDTAPLLNYVYFLQSTKTLTASTVGWPATEHAALATVLCQSAASLQTQLAYKDHAWTDHVSSTNDQGHISHLNYWIRQQDATYASGVAQTYTITPNGGSPDNVILTTTSGIVLQLHTHTFPAFSGTPDIYVVNDSVTPFKKITDLNAIDADSTGATLIGRYYSLVIWGCVSEDTGECKLYCNLPDGSYNNSPGVEDDISEYANYAILDAFKGTGFLISEWKLRQTAAASGTWTSIAEIDLRGLKPSATPGGTIGGLSPLTTKGDIYTYDTENTRLAIGADATTLIADSAQATGNKWGVLQEAGGGTAQSTYTTGNILYASATDTLSKLAPGGIPGGQLMVGFDDVLQWFDPTKHVVMYDDFASSSLSSWLGWDLTTTGVTRSSFGNEGMTNPGVQAVEVNGVKKALLRLSQFNQGGIVILGGGRLYMQWIVKTNLLSTATNTYTYRVGFNSEESATWKNGCWFEYTHSVNSGNFVIVNDKNGAQTTANTSFTMDTNFHVFGIEVNAGGTSSKFYIDGTEVSGSPLGSNLPIVTTSPSIMTDLTVFDGTTVSMSWDQFYYYQELTTPR